MNRPGQTSPETMAHVLAALDELIAETDYDGMTERFDILSKIVRSISELAYSASDIAE